MMKSINWIISTSYIFSHIFAHKADRRGGSTESTSIRGFPIILVLLIGFRLYFFWNFSLGSLSRLHILWISSDSVSMSSSSQLELSLMVDLFGVSIDVRFLLTHAHFCFIIDSVLYLIFGKSVYSVTHWFEHYLMLYFALPYLLFLLCDLSWPTVGIRNVSDLLEELIFNFGSRIGYEIARLCLYFATFISSRLFLFKLLLLNIVVSRTHAS